MSSVKKKGKKQKKGCRKKKRNNPMFIIEEVKKNTMDDLIDEISITLSHYGAKENNDDNANDIITTIQNDNQHSKNDNYPLTNTNNNKILCK